MSDGVRPAAALVRLDDPAAAAAWCAERRAAGRSLGFVPTMGALHDGHLSLVRRARLENDVVCVSVFVNPLQFDDASDLARYPRDPEGDAALLERGGCDMLFTGTLASFFPEAAGGAPEAIARVAPGPAASGLEGAHRPGHFEGVATIVERLFDLVRPDRAYFGEKDFQQLQVVRELARRRGGPGIVACPTVREPDGLALSSRNARLAPGQREHALALHRALLAARAAWRAGERDPGRLVDAMRAVLERAPVGVDYAEVRDPERWSAERPAGPLARAVALVAARVGDVRLIDELRLDEP